MTIGKNIRAVRIAAGWSQTEAAKRAGMSLSQWHDLESGMYKSPRIDTLRRMAKAVNCDVADLL